MIEASREKPSLSLNSQLILDEATRRKITVEYVPLSDYFILSYKDNIKTLRRTLNSMGYSSHAMRIINDKSQTKIFLKYAGISVPKGVALATMDKSRIAEVFESLKKPLVVKPTGRYGGESVYVNIHRKSDLLKKNFSCLKDGHKEIVVEEQFIGTEYRIFSTKEKTVAISCRVPANVIGDGTNTISQLIEIKNSDENRGGDDYKKPLLKIVIDDTVKAYLKEQKLSLKSIPKKGKQIFLRKNSNLSTGGDSIDFTDVAHPSVMEIAKRAINSIPELPYAGIDFITQDITKEQNKDSYVIIEMNAGPMISMHHFPYEGKSRDAAKAIIDIVFPETKE